MCMSNKNTGNFSAIYLDLLNKKCTDAFHFCSIRKIYGIKAFLVLCNVCTDKKYFKWEQYYEIKL